MIRHKKINATKCFAFKIFIMYNFECGQFSMWYIDRVMTLYRYFQPLGAYAVPDSSVFSVPLELNPQRTVWNPSHGRRWSHVGVGRQHMDEIFLGTWPMTISPLTTATVKGSTLFPFSCLHGNCCPTTAS